MKPPVHGSRSHRPRRRLIRAVVRGGVCAGLLAVALGQPLPEYELPPINYSATPASNAVTRLAARLQTDPGQLWGANEQDTVHRWLRALAIPRATQVLVFSKTSLQRRRIDPAHPRAVFFSDDIYLG